MSIAKRNIRALTWANLLGGVNFLEPVATLFYLHRGFTATEIFFVLLSFSVSMAVFEVPTGAFADRFGAKKSFLAGAGARLLSVACLAVPEPAFVILSQILSALSYSFFSGADEALIYESLKSEGREKEMGGVIGKIQAAAMAPMAAAMLLGGWLAGGLREVEFLHLIGLRMLCVLGQILFLLHVVEPPHLDAYRDHPWKHVRQGFREISRSPGLLLLFANVTVVFITTYVFTTFEQPWLKERGLPVQALGMVAAGGFLLAAWASHAVDRLLRLGSPKFWMVTTGIGIVLSHLLMVGIGGNLVAAVFAGFLLRASRAVRNPVSSQLFNEYISSGSRATALSLLSVADSAFDLVLVLSLSAVSLWGLPAVFLSCAGIALAGMLLPVRTAEEESAEMQERQGA